MPSRSLARVLSHLHRLAEPVNDLGPDVELLRRFVTERSEDAFAAIVRRHGPLVLRVLAQVLSAAEDVEDAFQAAFLVLVRKASSISRGDQLAGWLYGVAYRVAVRVRATGCRRRFREQSVAEIPVPKDQPASRPCEHWWMLHEEVMRLPKKYHLPVVLCYLEGKTHEEAARELGWPKGTLSGRLARARDLLHRRLTRRGLVMPVGGLVVLLWAGSAPAALPPKLLSVSVASAMALVAGVSFSGTISASVSSLLEGVLRVMLIAKLKTLGVILLPALAMGAILTGIVLAGSGSPHEGPNDQLPTVQAAAPQTPRPAPKADDKEVVALAKAPVPAQEDKKDPPKEKQPKERQTIALTGPGFSILAIKPDNKVVVVNTASVIECWDLGNGQKLAEGLDPNEAVDVFAGRFAVSPDGRTFTWVDRKGARTWDSATKERKSELKWPGPTKDVDTGELVGPAPVVWFAIAGDASRAAICREDGAIATWDLANAKEMATITTGNKSYRAFALSPDGKTLAVMSNGAPKLFDSALGKETLTLSKSINPSGGASAELRFAADGKTLMLIADESIELWDLVKKELRATIKTAVRYPLGAAALSPDGKTLALAAQEKKIKVIDVATGKERFELPWVSSPACVIFSPDGRSLASLREARIRIWEIPPVE
jgi:RNA polymerase sigma factor (sigma-70 family)